MRNLLFGSIFMLVSSFTFSQVTLEQAKEFMKKRCVDINMEFVDCNPFKWDEDSTLYVFLTKKDENYCVSMVSQYALEVMKTDCGGTEKKVQYYNLFK
jgi:hypothetical protein